MRLLVAATLLTLGSAASAQTVNIMPGAVRPAQQPPRIQVSVQASQASSKPADDQVAIQEALRRRLYEAMARECALITDVFKAECRMVSLNINSNTNRVMQPGGAGDQVVSSASATFELGPKPAN